MAASKTKGEELNGGDKLARGRKVTSFRAFFRRAASVFRFSAIICHVDAPSVAAPENAFHQANARGHERFEKPRLKTRVAARSAAWCAASFTGIVRADQMDLRLHSAEDGEREIRQQQQRDHGRGKTQSRVKIERGKAGSALRPTPVEA